jgi:hypothetical protein
MSENYFKTEKKANRVESLIVGVPRQVAWSQFVKRAWVVLSGCGQLTDVNFCGHD